MWKVGDSFAVPGFICKDIKQFDKNMQGNTLTIKEIDNSKVVPLYRFKETTYTCADVVLNMCIKRN